MANTTKDNGGSPVLAVTNGPLVEDCLCPHCQNTGLTYEGNGHRMIGYPFAEKHVSVSCSCAIGQLLDALEPGAIEREREAIAIADDLMREATA
ncbi:hypothetical protein VWZ88_12660 [Phaeobacter sp. JH20_36]|uniref:hypothetical protein n=1 Tax=unclassified Phaeobacter TaxID=2621772 RepID=UPI003A89969C